MKKFIFSASVILLIALVPGVLFGYLYNSNTQNKPATETVSDVTNGQEGSSIIGMVKSF